MTRWAVQWAGALILALVFLAVFAFALDGCHGTPLEQPIPPGPVDTGTRQGSAHPGPAHSPDYLAAAADVNAATAAYLDALEADRLKREADEAEAQAQARANMAPAPPAGPSGNRPSSAAGPCGGATNGADAYIWRESRGDPGVYNTGGSGAYGCYQIMPATWAASCSDLGPLEGSSPQAQAACASRLPLSAWGGR